MKKHKFTYEKSGVNINAADNFVNFISNILIYNYLMFYDIKFGTLLNFWVCYLSIWDIIEFLKVYYQCNLNYFMILQKIYLIIGNAEMMISVIFKMILVLSVNF